MTRSAEHIADGLDRHSTVVSTSVDGSVISVERADHGYPLPTVHVLVVDARHLTPSEVAALPLETVDAVVVTGTYDWAAKDVAYESHCGLFTVKQLWGALTGTPLHTYDTQAAKYFIERINSHDNVRSLTRVGESVFEIERWEHEPLLAYCADEYILSEACAAEILGDNRELDLITNLSSWNSSTPEAERYAAERGVRIFDLGGTYGALNLGKRRIGSYVPKGRR